MAPQTESSTILRIRRMEALFRILRHAMSGNPGTLRTDPALAAMLEELTAYYDSPLWLADYEADERGELPPDLPRGVLSQDGVYNLLLDIHQQFDP